MQSGIDIPLERVVSATGGAVMNAGALRFSAAVIDGRDVPKGALFFAVKGDRFDGHDFAGQAVAAGADGVVVARGRGASLQGSGAATVIEVDDPVAALGKLAHAQRQAMPECKVVAITGSNGKTTTKEMMASILVASAGADAVLKTEGNLNNHLGVPLTLLRLTASHRFAVIEMGMSALGEIAYLTQLARPDVGVVVSIAPVHLEGLGTIENIARAKGEIWQGLAEGGFAVLPVDDERLQAYVANVPAERRFTFGPRTRLQPTVGYEDVTADQKGITVRLHLKGHTSRTGALARIPMVGAHNASNAAAAAAAALALEVGEGSILEGLATAKPAKHRAQLVAVGDRTVLDDCYNASPLSMRAALDALVSTTPAGHQKIAVLGDMLELGADSPSLHRELGRYAAAHADLVIAFGALGKQIAEGAIAEAGAARVAHTDDPREAAERAWKASKAGDVILVKASRGMKLERVIDALFQLARGG